MESEENLVRTRIKKKNVNERESKVTETEQADAGNEIMNDEGDSDHVKTSTW